MILRPEDVWPVDEEYAASYSQKVAIGRETAKSQECVLVGIARNACPWLNNTLALVDEVSQSFGKFSAFVFENDSDDETKDVLSAWRDSRPWASVEMTTLGGADSRGFEKERTRRLALARSVCMQYVRAKAPKATYTIVLDLDPQHGFSVEGVLNSIGWLADKSLTPYPAEAGGMASLSLYKVTDGENVSCAHYDAPSAAWPSTTPARIWPAGTPAKTANTSPTTGACGRQATKCG